MDKQHGSVHECVEAESHKATGKRARGPADGDVREYHRCQVCGRHICFHWPNRVADENDFSYYEA